MTAIKESLLLKYIQRTASEEEMELVELSMMEDPDLVDELIVLESLQRGMMISSSMTDLHTKRDTDLIGRVLNFFSYPSIGVTATAASFLLAFLLFNQSPEKTDHGMIIHELTIAQQKGQVRSIVARIPNTQGLLLLSVDVDRLASPILMRIESDTGYEVFSEEGDASNGFLLVAVQSQQLSAQNYRILLTDSQKEERRFDLILERE